MYKKESPCYNQPDAEDFEMRFLELEEEEEPERLNYELWIYNCGTAECSTCGVIGKMGFPPGDFAECTPGERILAFNQFKHVKDITAEDDDVSGNLAFNDAAKIGNYYCTNCKGLGSPIVWYVCFAYDDWFRWGDKDEDDFDEESTEQEEDEEENNVKIYEFLEHDTNFITIQEGGLIVCKDCGPIGRSYHVPTQYIAGYAEHEVLVLNQDGNRIEFVCEPHDELPEWKPIVPPAFGRNKFGYYCNNCEVASRTINICEDSEDSEDMESDDSSDVEIRIRSRKNRNKQKKTLASTPTSPITSSTMRKLRPYADEMKTHQEKNVAVKMLINYSTVCNVEDLEEDVSKKMYSKKSRHNDIRRERTYKQYSCLV